MQVIILAANGPQELLRIMKTSTYEKLLNTASCVLKAISVEHHNKRAILREGQCDQSSDVSEKKNGAGKFEKKSSNFFAKWGKKISIEKIPKNLKKVSSSYWFF
jgi:hypothetical protein